VGNFFHKVVVVFAFMIFPIEGVQVTQAYATSWSTSMSKNQQQQLLAQTTSLNLTQQGSGELKIGTRSPRIINRVSVTVRPNRSADLSLTYAHNGGILHFGARLISRTNNTFSIALTNSGNADASGEVRFVLGASNSISSVSGSGRIDSQPLSLQFSGGFRQ